ncbi:MAG: nicotinamide mononucleotide transporter [Clostridia bacterium]|nr:nicotinamide mononucleotide transporter [Clostridia bacterium]
MLQSIRDLTRGERLLWICSAAAVTASFLLFGREDWLTLIGSLIGVTALIFVARGYVLGQVLTVAFSLFYGVISFGQRYYGEMITYLGMTSPIAILTVISWLRHPYAGTREVEVKRLSIRGWLLLLLAAGVVTWGFYYILDFFGNANMLFSTISITTSFLASALTLLRSPWYAAAYAANDLVLIVLWIMASTGDTSCLPMVVCFAAFFFNDVYGFISWRRMAARQRR